MSIAFPSYDYAQAAKNSIEVDPPFSDTKTKKSTIKREMTLRSIEGCTITAIDVVFTCSEDELNSMRTCISSFVANMSLVSETMKEFGN